MTIGLSIAGVAMVLALGWWVGACISEQARHTSAAEELLDDLDAEAARWR